MLASTPAEGQTSPIEVVEFPLHPRALYVITNPWFPPGITLSKAYVRQPGGHWREADKSFARSVAPNFTNRWQVNAGVVEDLSHLHRLRTSIATWPSTGLVLGQGSEATRARFIRSDVLAGRSIDEHTRDARSFKDAPSVWFPLDVDGAPAADLLGDFDAADSAFHGQAAALALRACFRASGLPDWLCNAGMSVCTSSKFGLNVFSSKAGALKSDTGKLPAHVFLELVEEQALTRAEAGALAAILNEEVEGFGNAAFLDLSIYKPERFLFTAAPRLYEHDGVEYKLLDHPVKERFGFLKGDKLRLPDDVFSEVKRRAKSGFRATSKARKKPNGSGARGLAPTVETIPELLASLQEGKRNDGMLRLQWRLMKANSRESWPVLKEQLREQLQKHAAFGDDEWQAKLVPGADYDKAWAGAERKLTSTPAVAEPVPEPAPLERQQRNQAKRDVLRERAQKFAASTGEGTTKWLFATHGPGFGKSTAFRQAASPEQLSKSSVVWFSPTKLLAAETAAKTKEYLRGRSLTEQQADQLVHTLASFEDTCMDERRKKQGMEYAAHASLKATVCANCPLRRRQENPCTYPDQTNWRAGITNGQHAHLLTSFAKAELHTTVVDESLLGALMTKEDWPLDLAPITTLGFSGARRKYTKVKRRDGSRKSAGELLKEASSIESILLNLTVDLEVQRMNLLHAFEAAAKTPDGILTAEFVRPLGKTLTAISTYRTKAGVRKSQTREVSAFSAALENEQDHEKVLRALLQVVLRARADHGFDLATALQGEELAALSLDGIAAEEAAVALVEAGTRDLVGALKLTKFLQRCFRAVGSCLRFGRKEVYGIRVLSKADENGRHSWFVRCTIRNDLPPGMANPPPEEPSKRVAFLDGTMSPLVARVLASRFSPKPEIEFLHDQLEPGPYLLRQYEGLYGTGFFDGDGKDSRSNLNRLWRFVLFEAAEARNRPGKQLTIVDGQRKVLLLVCTKAVAEKLRALDLPDDVGVLTFGNLRGLDVYRHIRSAVIVGRAQMGMQELELAAEGLLHDFSDSKSIERVPRGAWPTVRVQVTDAAGNSTTVLRERHPDAHVETVRKQLVDAEVMQACARLRLDDRDDDSWPVIHVFGTTELPWPVTQWCFLGDADRTPLDFMRQAGLVCRSPEEVSRLVPGAAGWHQNSLQRLGAEAWERHEAECGDQKLPPTSMNHIEAGRGGSYIGVSGSFEPLHLTDTQPAWETVTYRVAGRRGPPSTASVDRRKFPTDLAVASRLRELNGGKSVLVAAAQIVLSTSDRDVLISLPSRSRRECRSQQRSAREFN